MSRLLLRQVVVDGDVTDVLITDGVFTDLAAGPGTEADEVIDAAGVLALVPPFYNSHTHAAMTLLRGYAEDLELGEWLNEFIWPAEAKLTSDDVYAGSRLAIVEMIRSGTVFFNDMYWEQMATVRAAVELGVRAEIGLLHISGPDGQANPRAVAGNEELLAAEAGLPDRITVAHAPHSPYAASPQLLQEVADDAAASGRRIHIHASETAAEVTDSLRLTGKTPIAYLDSIGLVTPRTILAHCVHLSDDDRRIIADRGAVIAHMPVSNLKLCSGFFAHDKAVQAGCRIVLGTDGAASNNSLSMLAEMKSAALLAKSQAGSPLAGRDSAMLDAATSLAAEAFGIDGGRIAPGAQADAILVKLNHPLMVSDHSIIANLVYAADSSVVDTVICDGRVLMRHGDIPGEDEIIAEAREAVARVRSRRAP